MTVLQLERPHGSIAYDDSGDGPVVLCIPSPNEIRSEYRHLTPLLRKAGYRVVSCDLRGRGQSSAVWPSYETSMIANDILALLSKLNIGPCVVLASTYSIGAAVWAATEQASAFAGVALIGAYKPAQSGLNRVLNKLAFHPLIGRQLILRTYAKLYQQTPADLDDYLFALLRNLGEPNRLEALRKLLDQEQASWYQRLGSLKVPTLLLNSTSSNINANSQADFQAILKLLAQGRGQLIDGCAYLPHVEVPQACFVALQPFLAEVLPIKQRSVNS